MCPLQITNDIEHLSSTLHGVNETFIRHPSNVENYSNGHKSETDQKKKKKKKVRRENIFLHLCAHFWLKIPNTHRYNDVLNFFRHLDNQHLTAHQMAQRQYGQKSKIH